MGIFIFLGIAFILISIYTFSEQKSGDLVSVLLGMLLLIVAFVLVKSDFFLQIDDKIELIEEVQVKNSKLKRELLLKKEEFKIVKNEIDSLNTLINNYRTIGNYNQAEDLEHEIKKLKYKLTEKKYEYKQFSELQIYKFYHLGKMYGRNYSSNIGNQLSRIDENIISYINLLPKFAPTPPPTPSSFYKLKTETTIKQIHETLLKGLDTTGYHARFYYQIDNGFVIVTELENINNDGSVFQRSRWGSLGPLVHYFVAFENFSFREYLKGLFLPKKNKSRLFVFWVSSKPFNTKLYTNTKSKLDQTLVSDGVIPSDEYIVLDNKSDSAKYSCTVLTYEFDKGEYESDNKLISNSRITARQHLEKSGLMKQFKEHEW